MVFQRCFVITIPREGTLSDPKEDAPAGDQPEPTGETGDPPAEHEGDKPEEAETGTD